MSLASMPVRRLFPLLAGVIFVLVLVTGAGTALAAQRAFAAQDALRVRVAAQERVDRIAYLGERVQLNNLVKSYVPGEAATQATGAIRTDLAEITRIGADVGGTDLSAEERSAVAALSRAYTEFAQFITTLAPPRTAAETAAIATEYTSRVGVAAEATTAAQKVIAQHREAEDDAARSAVQQAVGIVAVLCVLIGLGVAGGLLFFGRRHGRQLGDVAAGLSRVSEGDFTSSVPVRGAAEVAEMARSLNGMTDQLRSVFARISEASTRLGTASNSLEDTAARVGRSAQSASSEAEQVSRSADEVSQNVQAVAAGSEEMGASITEIAQNANQAARVATGAVAAVESTTGTMNQLGESSREIGDVVRLITSIAEQTNLLALNATIEAARAGDAGKGFAVVADEVKQLAQETARATEDISRRVEAIQENADQAGRAIADIAGVITRINEFQTTIASAVEEQTATTQAINAGVADAAQGSQQIARTISGVAGVTGETASSMAGARESARELSAMSLELERLVIGFRY